MQQWRQPPTKVIIIKKQKRQKEMYVKLYLSFKREGEGLLGKRHKAGQTLRD
jgi:hypothetical protein